MYTLLVLSNSFEMGRVYMPSQKEQDWTNARKKGERNNTDARSRKIVTNFVMGDVKRVRVCALFIEKRGPGVIQKIKSRGREEI